MAAASQQSLIAVDTNVLLDYADGDGDVIESFALIRERLPGAVLVVTPTVMDELNHLRKAGEPEEQALALKALMELRSWGIQPVTVFPVGNGIIEQIGFKLRLNGLIPEDEEHDSWIVAEAALSGCSMLLSSDRHLLDAQEGGQLIAFLRDQSVDGDSLIIGKPADIARRFFRRR